MTDSHGSSNKSAIAVDLDGTLAEYHGWKGVEHIGEPIGVMAARVDGWIRDGKRVVIFTARVSGPRLESKIARMHISAWLKANHFPDLEITCIKEKYFKEFWDDRAVQVKCNTGERIG